MRGLQGFVVVLLALFFCLIADAHAEAVPETDTVRRVGVTSFRDKSVTIREWQPTMDYLSSRMPGTHFIAVPLTLPEFEIALAHGELDFVLTNPQHYIIMETRFGVSRLATLVKRENGVTVNRFGGVIFTRSDRPDIQRLEDLKGKHIAAVDRTSFAAFLLQYDLARQVGLDLDKDTHLQFLGFPQDNCVMAVLEGRADAGFARSGVLEAMAREGSIPLSSLRIIQPAPHRDFPFLVSTGLYPEWPLAAAPHVPIDVANQVAATLLMMPPDHPAARSARYYRWSTPLEYQQVQAVMRRHHIYPYDKSEPINLRDVLQQYLLPVAIGLALMVLGLAILYVRTRQLNVALKASRLKLSDMAHQDALTGLPNRNLLEDRLTQALAQADRANSKVAICLADLDGFKPINDKLGHKAGDDVLQDIANNLKATVRAGDTVARWGGDEFVLLITGITDIDQIDETMRRVLAAVARSNTHSGGLPVSASIGVSIFPTDAQAPQTLFKNADAAMYEAKKRGGNCHVLHAAEPVPA
ncbi:diguanylate cyclase [Zoogloea sp. 1C4]|uniref:diguanylate cyclase domain-containing protein n=1 Tax=Zoogloea sp. 1C4 TaxID=2570190 RepID=UPI001885A1D5|nr:diguanylate cyclase [Zoogloea sp. 1C4]